MGKASKKRTATKKTGGNIAKAEAKAQVKAANRTAEAINASMLDESLHAVEGSVLAPVADEAPASPGRQSEAPMLKGTTARLHVGTVMYLHLPESQVRS